MLLWRSLAAVRSQFCSRYFVDSSRHRARHVSISLSLDPAPASSLTSLMSGKCCFTFRGDHLARECPAGGGKKGGGKKSGGRKGYFNFGGDHLGREWRQGLRRRWLRQGRQGVLEFRGGPPRPEVPRGRRAQGRRRKGRRWRRHLLRLPRQRLLPFWCRFSHCI